MTQPLTPRQSEIVEVIKTFFAANQRMPTYREIGDAVGITTPSGVACQLEAIRKKGVIEIEERGKLRNFRLCGYRAVLVEDAKC